MDVIAYSQRLVGRATPVSTGVVRRSERASSGDFRLEAEALVSSEGAFREDATLVTPDGDVLRLRTLGTGLVVESTADGARLGTVTWEVDGGTGRWSNAAGRISSTFALSADGDVVDEQHGFVLLGPPSSIGGSP
jgi:hypothetical protein